MTPRQLYEWASVSIQAVHFEYSSMEDYRKEAEHLQQQFILSRTISGTRKYHSFIPKVKVAYYSSSDTLDNILTVVNPRTRSGRVYTLSQV